MLCIDSLVYTALKADSTINAAVGSRIYHNGDYNGGKYPAVTYSEISNVPALNADDEEQYARSTYQINILSTDNKVAEIATAVERVMLGLDFCRQAYGDLDNGQVKVKVMRFTIVG
jgi:hypothetical protein